MCVRLMVIKGWALIDHPLVHCLTIRGLTGLFMKGTETMQCSGSAFSVAPVEEDGTPLEGMWNAPHWEDRFIHAIFNLLLLQVLPSTAH